MLLKPILTNSRLPALSMVLDPQHRRFSNVMPTRALRWVTAWEHQLSMAIWYTPWPLKGLPLSFLLLLSLSIIPTGLGKDPHPSSLFKKQSYIDIHSLNLHTGWKHLFKVIHSHTWLEAEHCSFCQQISTTKWMLQLVLKTSSKTYVFASQRKPRRLGKPPVKCWMERDLWVLPEI